MGCMGSLEGGRRKVVEDAAKAALRTAMVVTTFLNPDASLAGRREASRIVEGIKMSDTMKPGVTAEDNPNDGAVPKFRIKEDT